METMGSPPTSTPSSPWIPEDDLLLTKAIEGGASLESLAKGAVRFSRRFTLQELRDRWRSLLYDPDISAEASARMAELERSAGNLKESKRAENREIEFESIRRCYYAANRKRICTRQLDPRDFLLGEADLDDLRRLLYGDAGHEFDHGMDLPVSDYEPNFDHLQYLCTPPATPQGRKTDEISGYGEVNTLTARRQLDFAAPSYYPLNFSEDENLLMEADVKEIEKFGLENLFNYPVDTSVDEMLDAYEIEPIEMDMRDHEQLDSFVDLSDYLLSEDDMPSVDADGEEVVLLDSPVDVNEDQMLDASQFIQLDGIEEQNVAISESVLDPHPELCDGAMDADGKEVDEQGLSELLLDSPVDVNEDEILDASQGIPLEQNMPISVSVLDPHPKLRDGVICCTLNTEDLDVPFNDDVVFPGTHPSTSGAPDGLNCEPPIGEPLLSDEEEQLSDNDAEIPSFSDVESLILDMDLIPKDQDMYPSREVEKYQHEDAKRAIIRLEQAARACMQRSIASHGAFAVLYGHHSKHYIKKPEVLLGRGTEGGVVDIDLSAEGPVNKISRQQAILKMDEGGLFHVRNLGKCLISVDGKDVSRNQSLSLHSNCLIEIGRMAFIFEVNQVRVDQYLDSISRKTLHNVNKA